MGRMIDADDFIEQLGSSDREIYFKGLIEEQPTAFDVNVVVKELEDYQKWKDFMIYDLTYREREVIKRAIEIVRKGGVK